MAELDDYEVEAEFLDSAGDFDIWQGLEGLTERQRFLWANFSFHGAMRRQGYWGYYLFNGLLLGLPLILVRSVLLNPYSQKSDFLFISCLVLLLLMLVWIVWSLLAMMAKRARSSGYPPQLAILLFIPFLGGLLWLFLGFSGQNQASHRPVARKKSNRDIDQ